MLYHYHSIHDEIYSNNLDHWQLLSFYQFFWMSSSLAFLPLPLKNSKTKTKTKTKNSNFEHFPRGNGIVQLHTKKIGIAQSRHIFLRRNCACHAIACYVKVYDAIAHIRRDCKFSLHARAFFHTAFYSLVKSEQNVLLVLMICF